MHPQKQSTGCKISCDRCCKEEYIAELEANLDRLIKTLEYYEQYSDAYAFYEPWVSELAARVLRRTKYGE